MRKSGIVLMSFAASLLATAAIAQGMSGNTGMTSPAAKAAGADGGSTMSNAPGGAKGAAMSGGMNGGMAANPMNSDPATAFTKEDMIMMIVDRDRNTKGMTDEQKKEARAKEAQMHGAGETKAQRVDRKNAYAAGWAKLTPAEKTSYTAMYEDQQRQRAAAAAGAAGGATPNAGNMGAMGGAK